MVWMKQCRPANLSIVLGLAFVLVLMYYTLYTEMNASRVERVSLRLLLRTSIIAAIRGGNEIVKFRPGTLKPQSKGKNDLGQDDLLTEADLRSHRVILRTLFDTFPRLNIVSEENSSVDLMKASPTSGLSHETHLHNSDISQSLLEEVNLPESISHYSDETIRMQDILVWVDPLDATQEFTEGLKKYVTTMVCIAVRGQPRIGVIHLPFSNRTVWAWVGQGTSKSLRTGDDGFSGEKVVFDADDRSRFDKSPIEKVSAVGGELVGERDFEEKGKKKDIVRVVVSRSHAGRVKEFATENLSGCDVHAIEAGGAGFKALQVAEGKADLYVHTTLIKKWDICSGAALLETLGGQFLTRTGKSLDFGQKDQVENSDGVLAFLKNDMNFIRLAKASMSK